MLNRSQVERYLMQHRLNISLEISSMAYPITGTKPAATTTNTSPTIASAERF